MMKKKVSLKDIAQAVGVSTALVSYVLNGKEKEARVGKDIAEEIRKVARELDYQPNQIAKSLKSGKSQTLGLVVADISNPFFANIARTIEDEAKKHNYTVIFGSSDETAEKSWDLINVLIKRQVDGFIIAPSEHSESQMEYLISQNIPFVLVDRYFPDIPSSFVVTDNYQASFRAVSHLIDVGRKRIGMLAYKSNLIHMKDRKRGFKDAVRNKGLPPNSATLKEVDYVNIGKEVENVMKDFVSGQTPVDAIFFATNTLSIHGLKYLNKAMLKVPGDVAVVCFDESDAFDFFYSPITFVNQPVLEVGREAVRILIEEINNKAVSKRQIVISSELIIRQSSGA